MLFIRILILFFLSTSLFAKWTPINNGIPPAPVNDIVLIGNQCFSIVGDKLFYSSDNGVIWLPKMNYPGGSNARIYVQENHIYISSDLGIYKSTDRGDSWIEKNNGLDYLTIRGMAFIGNKMYALGYSGNKKLYLSDNNGDNWKAVTGDFKTPSGRCIMSHGNDLYIGTQN